MKRKLMLLLGENSFLCDQYSDAENAEFTQRTQRKSKNGIRGAILKS